MALFFFFFLGKLSDKGKYRVGEDGRKSEFGKQQEKGDGLRGGGGLGRGGCELGGTLDPPWGK
jgi:hypothetical protein